jgi:hypothetical protein
MVSIGIRSWLRLRKKFPDNISKSIPVRGKHQILSDGGGLSLMFPKYNNERLGRILVPPWSPLYNEIQLDDWKTSLWSEISGEITVTDICERLGSKMNGSFPGTEQLQETVESTLREFFAAGCISFK